MATEHEIRLEGFREDSFAGRYYLATCKCGARFQANGNNAVKAVSDDVEVHMATYWSPFDTTDIPEISATDIAGA